MSVDGRLELTNSEVAPTGKVISQDSQPHE